MKTPWRCHLGLLLDLGDDGVDGEVNLRGDASDGVRRTAHTRHSSLSFIGDQSASMYIDIRW